MDDSGNLIEGLEHSGGSFRMNHRDDFIPLLFERIGKLLRIKRGPPFCVDSFDASAASLRNIDHAGPEDSVDAYQHVVSRLDQIDETGFHAGAAGSRHR